MSHSLPRWVAVACASVICAHVQAQNISVKGTIRDAERKQPIEGAAVRVSGGKAGAMTGQNGSFIIEVPRGTRLIISAVGFEETVVTVTADDMNINLKPRSSDLEEVVVAMDRKLKRRELGFSDQSVSGKELQESQRENIVNGLAGRVAGLTVNPTSGVAGASSSIVLRGFNSLSLSNQPLFVVDGIILDNSTLDENSNTRSGIGLASDRSNRNNDYSNRIADINPNDIENVTVLKGPEATALYGSQASSGAIVITTRKAKSNKLAVQYDNSFRISEVTRFPKTFSGFQNGRNGLPSAEFRYFGLPMNPGQPVYDNINAFFKTGFAQTHNLGADFGFKKSIFRVSASLFDQDGVIPENNFRRYNFRISNTTKIGKWADISPSISYIISDNNKPLRGGGGYLTSLLIWPTNQDVRRYQDDFGNKASTFTAAGSTNSEFDNPFFNVYNNRSRDQNWRGIGSLSVNLYPTKWLTVAGRFGYDGYNSDGYTLYHPQSFYVTPALNGSLDNYNREYRGYNHTVTATAKRTFGKFSTRLMGGTMWQDYRLRQFSVSGNGLIDVKRFDSSNTNPASRIRLSQNNFGRFNQQITKQFAIFGEAAISYNNLLFLTYTHRFEQASTLPKANRDYNYPGASVSAIMTDILPVLKRGNVLTYWKLRGSAATTARLNTPYSTQSVFVNSLSSRDPSLFEIFTYGFTNANPDLRPEKQSTYEIGTELKFFKSRFGLDVTYYNTLVTDQIIENFRLSYGTGFVLNTQNAGSTRNQGIEVVMDVTPVAKQNLNWNIRFNFNRMWNKVIALPPSVTEYYIADTWLFGNARAGLIRGGSTTSITTATYRRNNAGKLLISPTTGLPMGTGAIFTVVGDRNPTFTLGTINNLRYKNWNLSFLWDLKMGGDIFNGTKAFLTQLGRSELTQDRLVPRVVEGVLEDGLQNSANPTPNNIVVIPNNNDLYYSAAAMPEEVFVEKNVNWLRLRDLTLSYTFSRQKTGFMRQFKNLSVFATLNDAILITNYSGADPAVNGNTAGTRGVGAFGFDYGSLPAPVSLNIGLRAGF